MAAADHLNPQQHHEYIYTHDSDTTDYGTRMDDYKLIRRTTNELGDVEHTQLGNLTVNRYRDQPERFEHPPTPDNPNAYGHRWYDDYETSSSVGNNPDWASRSTPRQGKLFAYSPPKAGEHKVDYLGGTEGARAANTVMLGIAENAARREGTTLQPSEDLSEHSSRMVGHLKESGAVAQNAPTQVTNEIQFAPEYPLGRRSPDPNTRLPEEEVQAGRQTVRDVVRGNKPRRDKSQGTLF